MPGKLIEVSQENGLRMGRIDYGGTVTNACLEYLPEAEVGQYVVVHAGFGLSVINEKEAAKTLAVWKEMYDEAAKQGVDIHGRKLLQDQQDQTEEPKR
jgi:hydrogenase expression/formation protein HypC